MGEAISYFLRGLLRYCFAHPRNDIKGANEINPFVFLVYVSTCPLARVSLILLQETKCWNRFNQQGEVVMGALLDLLKDNLVVILGGVVGALLGLLLSYGQIGKIIRMFRTSTGEIASLPADEQVEIVGKADGEATLQSPIAKTRCVLWQVVVSERRSSGKRSRWVTVYSNTSTAPFDVYDGTGRIRVYPSRPMELLLQDDVSKASGIFYSLDEQTKTALNELGVDTKGFLNLNKTMRVQERYIEQGDQVYLLGRTSLQSGARVMDGDSPLIVSDHSELRLLGRFSWQVLINALIGVFVGAVLTFSIMN
jgi:hypothetical protein